MRYEIREFGASGILDQTTTVIKDRWWLFVEIAMVTAIPGLVFRALKGLTTLSLDTDQSVSIAAIVTFWFLLWFVVYPFAGAALIYAVAHSYLDSPTRAGIAFGRARHVFLPLLGTLVPLWFILALGLIALLVPIVNLLLLVPFVIFWLRYSLTSQVVVLEGLSGLAALRRSRQLMKENVGTAFVLFMWILVVSAVFILLQSTISPPQLGLIFFWLIQAALFIFNTTAWVIFYFSCRAKAEHFDLALLADAVGIDDNQPTGAPNPASGHAC